MRGSGSSLDLCLLESVLHLALQLCFFWGFFATVEGHKGRNVTTYGKEMTIKVENLGALKFLEIFFLGVSVMLTCYFNHLQKIFRQFQKYILAYNKSISR